MPEARLSMPLARMGGHFLPPALGSPKGPVSGSPTSATIASGVALTFSVYVASLGAP
jgi:hypothetical protein